MGEQETVRLEFVGEQTGTITYRGPSGREYRVANNDLERFIDVLPEDVQHLLQFPQFQMAPPTPPMAAVDESPIPITFFLNTSDNFFITWLTEHTQLIHMRGFPSAHGRIALQQARPVFSRSGKQTIDMPAFYIVPDPGQNREIAYPLSSAITFRTTSLASERIEVWAECNQPSVQHYFQGLLQAVAQRWPEAQPTIAAYIADRRIPQSLVALREQITSTQRAMLTAIWQHFCGHNEWMPITLLHHRFGRKLNARPHLEQLNGSIVVERQQPSRSMSYELTFLGVLLTEEGQYYERLVTNYLTYLIKRFVGEPLFREVTSQEVNSALHLSSEQSVILFHLIHLGGFWSGGSFAAPDWKADIPADIEDLADTDDLRAYLYKRLFERYDPNALITDGARSMNGQDTSYGSGRDMASGSASVEKLVLQNVISQPQLPAVDILLVTVTDIEARAVLDALKEPDDVARPRHFIENNVYHDLGLIGPTRALMVQSEMGSGGPSGAILTIQEGIKALSPAAVVMVGIAFGVNPTKQRLGDILVSQQIAAYELQRVGNSPSGELVIRPRGDRSQASSRMLTRFRAGALDWNKPRVQFGLILSGDKLIDNQHFRDELLRLEPEAIGGEMEGAGLYAAAQRSKVDWILIKAICDWADGDKSRNKRQRQQKAAKNAVDFTLHVLRQGGFSRSQ